MPESKVNPTESAAALRELPTADLKLSRDADGATVTTTELLSAKEPEQHAEELKNTKAESVSARGADDGGGKQYRYDIVMWMVGLLYIILVLAVMFAAGERRQWNAPSGYSYNASNNSQERFLPEPYTPEPGVYKRSDSEASGRWYYWKLRPELVTVWTKLFVWVCYIAHNLAVWTVLYIQHRAKIFAETMGPRYSTTPQKYNVILLCINAVFHLLHLVNTHVTYDGTAADTSEASSQSSVIVALILILFIEFKERGIMFGYPNPEQLRHRLGSIWLSPTHLVRKYHGYFIYWAAVYTFWYHPMENTIGHALGFAHTWMFMLQGSLAFQTFHLNKYWRILLEMWVALHGALVAVQTAPNIMGQELWPMFLFGFLTVLFLTSMYGLPFWKPLPAWSRSLPMIGYIIVLLITFSQIRDKDGQAFVRLAEVIRIPGIYYLLFGVAWLLIVLCVKIESQIKRNSQPDSKSPITVWKEAACLSAVLLTYIICVLLSWYFEFADWKVNLIVLTMIYCFAFMIIAAIIGSMFLKQLLPMPKY